MSDVDECYVTNNYKPIPAFLKAVINENTLSGGEDNTLLSMDEENLDEGERVISRHASYSKIATVDNLKLGNLAKINKTGVDEVSLPIIHKSSSQTQLSQLNRGLNRPKSSNDPKGNRANTK